MFGNISGCGTNGSGHRSQSQTQRLNKLSAIKILDKTFVRKAEEKELQLKRVLMKLHAWKSDVEESRRKQEEQESNLYKVQYGVTGTKDDVGIIEEVNLKL